MSGRPAFVFAGAPLAPTPRLRRRLAAFHDPVVIAADGGAGTALAFGFRPDVIVGDLDSIQPATLDALRGVPIDAYPRDKDATDGQIAVERALQFEPSSLVLLGFLGGPRLDQSAASLLMLATLPDETVLLDEANECRLLRGGQSLAWPPERDEVVSVLPLVGEARGVTNTGLRWPLVDATLYLGDTRGISNEPLPDRSEVGVRLASGLLLVTRHFAERPL